MCESITLYLPRTKCENVRVLFSRIRLLFGVLVDPSPDSISQEQDPQRNILMTGENSECSQFKLSVIEGGLDQLSKAKDYLLAACSDGSSRCERRCQYAPDIFQHLVPMRDEAERESSAVVRFESPDSQVVVSGQERNVVAAIRFLDAKAQDVVKCKGRAASSECGELTLSQAGTQSREVFRQGRNLESEDSSYDSDYEVTEPAAYSDPAAPDPHHDDVSRTVSDTLGAEFAEYVTQGSSVGGRELDTILADPSYTGRVEFALKLGYTESQVQTALQKLGPQPSQNELLAELIKLGASSSPSVFFHPQAAAPVAAPARLADSLRPEDTMAVIDHFDSSGVVGELAGDDPANLRHVVIDGSNVAMSHGNKECFSCRGIKICVDWFRARGHQNITVFVPRWRKENSRPDAPIKDQEILAQLEKDRLLVFTPSRHVGGRRLVCYDDRYILRLAVDSDGIVVSNDNYRDLAAENPDFKKIVEDRLLMYSFVNDRFMPPDDPLGRHGPSLDNFLRKSQCPSRPAEPLPPPCPYGKKCTYGNKCKYHHPERGNLPQKSVTERLAEQAKIPLQEVKSRGLKSRESSPGDKLKSAQMAGTAKGKKQPLSRTKSLVASVLPGDIVERSNVVERTKSEGAVKLEEQREKPSVPKPSNPYGVSVSYPSSWPSTMPQIPLTSETPSSAWATVPTTLPHNIAGAEMFLEAADGGGHLFVAKRLSDPDNKAMKSFPKQGGHPEMNLHRKLQRQLTLNPSYDPRLVQLGGYVDRTAHAVMSPPQDTPYSSLLKSQQQLHRSNSQESVQLLPGGGFGGHHHIPLGRLGSDGGGYSLAQAAVWDATPEHQTVTRIASAPDSSYSQWPTSARMQHLNSTSDTRLNLYPDPRGAAAPPMGGPDLGLAPRPHWASQGRGLGDPTPRAASVQMLGAWQEQRSSSLVQPVRPSSVPPPGMQPLLLQHQNRPASPDTSQDSARRRLFYHLASIFPKEQVQTVMELYPQETNPQKICAAILNMFPKG